jgi:hypothetical protein
MGKRIYEAEARRAGMRGEVTPQDVRGIRPTRDQTPGGPDMRVIPPTWGVLGRCFHEPKCHVTLRILAHGEPPEVSCG